MRNRKVKTVLMFFLTATLLSGCGDRPVDYSLDDTEVTESTQRESASGLAQLTDTKKWEAEWKSTTESGNTIEFEVNAEITVPEADSMHVIEVKAPEEGEAYTEQVVKAVFGDGEVSYYDDVRLPKEPLQEKIAYYEDEIAANQKLLEDQHHPVGASMEQEIQNTIEEEQEKLASCRAALETASENYTPVDAYDGEIYRGIIEGAAYILRVEWPPTDGKITFSDAEGGIISMEVDGDGPLNEQKEVLISLYPEDIYQVCPEEVAGAEGLAYDSFSLENCENECALTEQEAENVVKQTLENIGFSNPVQRRVDAIYWYGDMEDLGDGTFQSNTQRTDGYWFRYELGIDELSLTGFGEEVLYWDYDKSSSFYSMGAYADVYVTERGVIAMEVHNPVEVTGVTREVKLLPLENIQKIISDELMEHPDQYPFVGQTKVSFHSMELIYFRVHDDSREGYYSYIPSWRLCDHSSDFFGLTCENTVMVNAIDGSIIDLAEEFQ
ncbi:MAG: DUF6034 family protein [Lachnospiraceae bacterium]|nr:DUF6034 family protein [Lachnospiraceae bacterium]